MFRASEGDHEGCFKVWQGLQGPPRCFGGLYCGLLSFCQVHRIGAGLDGVHGFGGLGVQDSGIPLRLLFGKCLVSDAAGAFIESSDVFRSYRN